MNYSDVIQALKTASLFDLFRIGIAISHEMEDPARIKAVRLAFKVGDTVSFFDQEINNLKEGIVIEKSIKYVSLQDTKNAFRSWKVPYCFLNLANVNTDIHCQHREKLSKNNLRIGECVGFNNDGEQIIGIVSRLNFKTAGLITADRKRWRVGYGLLYKIIDTELSKRFAELNIIE